MPYIRPPLFTRRIFNPIAMRFGISGTRTLAVRTRRTGVIQRVPLIPVEVDGRRYIVSARGETDWARNLRAAGEAEISGPRAAPEAIRVQEVPTAERAPILDVYRRVAGRAVAGLFRRLPDPADHPVFRIE